MKKILLAALAATTLASVADAKPSIDRSNFYLSSGSQDEFNFLRWATSSHGALTISGLTEIEALRQRYDHVHELGLGVFNEHTGAEAACFFRVFHPDTADNSCDYARNARLYDTWYTAWLGRQ